jgi:endonuclease III
VSRLERQIGELREFYGILPTPPADAFTLFVWEVLSFHSTPQKRDAALGALKRNRSLTPDAMWKVAQKKLEESVKLAGPYPDQRLRALKTGVEIFRRNPRLAATIKGSLPGALRALKKLPRMSGDSGGYRMLLFAGEHRVMPVDAGVIRVVTRLGYRSRGSSSFGQAARGVRHAVAPELSDSLDAYRRAYTYLGHHGSTTCTDADPHCHVCPLLDECPFGQARAHR